MITIPHATEAIRMQGFQTHTAVQPISIQPLQTQQKPRVTEAQHNAERHSLLFYLLDEGELCSEAIVKHLQKILQTFLIVWENLRKYVACVCL